MMRDRDGDGYHSVFYLSYLGSDVWQAVRQKKLASVGHRCEHRLWGIFRCEEKVRLQVHHLTYDRLGNEKMSDLRVLCYRHHEQADRERKSRKK